MDHEIVELYDQAIAEIYELENLISLSDNGFSHNGINIQNNPKSQNPPPDWNAELNFYDILNCNSDLKYFTAQLYLHVPHINNPLTEVSSDFDIWVATYHQNLWDRRYLLYVSCCFEKAYNFWDRIGDLLWSFHQELIKNVRAVDFSRIVGEIEKTGEKDPDFLWLRDFQGNQYQKLNSNRIDVVHYHQYESSYRHRFLLNNDKREKIEELFEEKTSFPMYFKDHLDSQIEGCCRTYNFLHKLSQRV